MSREAELADSTRKIPRTKSRIPPNSVFFEKIIPALLIGMAILTVIFVLIALGVLLGLVPY